MGMSATLALARRCAAFLGLSLAAASGGGSGAASGAAEPEGAPFTGSLTYSYNFVSQGRVQQYFMNEELVCQLGQCTLKTVTVFPCVSGVAKVLTGEVSTAGGGLKVEQSGRKIVLTRRENTEGLRAVDIRILEVASSGKGNLRVETLTGTRIIGDPSAGKKPIGLEVVPIKVRSIRLACPLQVFPVGSGLP